MEKENIKIPTTSFLTKDDTLVLKGIAAILMLIHHLWGFPDRLPETLKGILIYWGIDSVRAIGAFGIYCVSMFAFLGGYGKFKKYSDKKVGLFGELKKLYIKYWEVFVIFIPIGFIFFSNQVQYCAKQDICNVFSEFSVKDLILNFFGLISTYNHEWWFLGTYLLCTCLFPLIKYLLNRFSIIMNLVFILLFHLAFLLVDISMAFSSSQIYNNIIGFKEPYIVCFYLGALVAKYELFSKLEEKIKNEIFKIILSLMIIIIVFILRIVMDPILLLETLYVFMVPFIFALAILCKKLSKLNKPLVFFGKHSTNMWLTHSFFCYYFGIFAKSIVFFKWAVPALLVLVAYTMATSLLLTYFWGFIEKGVKKLFHAKI